MKFAIIADIHFGIERKYEGVPMDEDINVFLDRFISEMNVAKPEFIIVLGDLIEGEDAVTDKISIEHISNLLKKTMCSVYFVAGNHNIKYISEKELAELFNQKNLYYSFDLKDYHFIILFSKKSNDDLIRIQDEQIKWLKRDLAITNKKSVVFVHHSLADQDLTGNRWFEGLPERCLIENRREIRDIFLESGNVVAVFNSHLHWSKQNIHGKIPYFTIGSLSDNATDKGIASETYALVEIECNKIYVDIKGKHPEKFNMDKI